MWCNFDKKNEVRNKLLHFIGSKCYKIVTSFISELKICNFKKTYIL